MERIANAREVLAERLRSIGLMAVKATRALEANNVEVAADLIDDIESDLKAAQTAANQELEDAEQGN